MVISGAGISYCLLFTAIIVVIALGGMLSERSGVLNIGLEGCATFGAFASCVLMVFLPSEMPLWIRFILIILVSMISGGLFSFLLSIPAIKFKANQTLIGTAINLLAPAIACVFVRAITGHQTGTLGNTRISYTNYYEYFSIPFFGNTTIKFNWLIIIALILVPIIWWLLYKTQFGLRHMACGENPSAADSVGINVNKHRYIGVTLSGILAGFGGLILLTSVPEYDFLTAASGYGFLALGVMIFGQWKPWLILVGSLGFGVFKSFSLIYPSIDFLAQLKISPYVYLALPYLVCLISLIFTSKNSKGPKAVGIPYDKTTR